MKIIDTRLVRLDEIVSGTDFERKLDSPQVTTVVHMLRLGRKVPHPVVLRARDKRVITGEDVLAAHVVIETDSLTCVLLECDEQEFLALRTADQARISLGRAVEDSAINELVSHIEGSVEEAVPEAKRRQKARELVAELIGTTPDALRKRDERRSVLPKKPRKTKPAVYELNTYGNVVSGKLQLDAEVVYRAMHNVSSAASHLMASLTRLSTTSINKDAVERMRAAASQVSSLARAQAPTHLCPYCKDVARVREACAACWHQGYVNELVYDMSPIELRHFTCVQFAGAYVDPKTLKPYRFPRTPVVVVDEESHEDEREPPREWRST